MKLKAGDWVRLRLRGAPREPVQIERIYSDIPGGVLLTRPVMGFRSWHVDNLRKVRKPA